LAPTASSIEARYADGLNGAGMDGAPVTQKVARGVTDVAGVAALRDSVNITE